MHLRKRCTWPVCHHQTRTHQVMWHCSQQSGPSHHRSGLDDKGTASQEAQRPIKQWSKADRETIREVPRWLFPWLWPERRRNELQGICRPHWWRDQPSRTDEDEQFEMKHAMGDSCHQEDDQWETTPVQPCKENAQGPTLSSVQGTQEQHHQSSTEGSLELHQRHPADQPGWQELLSCFGGTYLGRRTTSQGLWCSKRTASSTQVRRRPKSSTANSSRLYSLSTSQGYRPLSLDLSTRHSVSWL